MGILDELLAGGKRQNEYKDFVNRYEQGGPSEGYSDQEVLKRYGEMAHAVDQTITLRRRKSAEQIVAGRASGVGEDLQDQAAARGGRCRQRSRPNRRNWAKCSPICMGIRGSFGTCSAVAPPSVRSKRQGLARSSTS